MKIFIFIEIIANNHNITGYKSIENGKICQNVGGKRTRWKKRASMFLFNSFHRQQLKNRLACVFVDVHAQCSAHFHHQHQCKCNQFRFVRLKMFRVVRFDGKSMYAMLRKHGKKMLPTFRTVLCFHSVLPSSMLSFSVCVTPQLDYMQSGSYR